MVRQSSVIGPEQRYSGLVHYRLLRPAVGDSTTNKHDTHSVRALPLCEAADHCGRRQMPQNCGKTNAGGRPDQAPLLKRHMRRRGGLRTDILETATCGGKRVTRLDAIRDAASVHNALNVQLLGLHAECLIRCLDFLSVRMRMLLFSEGSIFVLAISQYDVSSCSRAMFPQAKDLVRLKVTCRKFCSPLVGDLCLIGSQPYLHHIAQHKILEKGTVD